MFPIQCCGLWTLVASTNPQCIGSELYINYNTITFTPVQHFAFVSIKKNKYASMYVNEKKVKVSWSDKIGIRSVETLNLDLQRTICSRFS